MFDNETRLSISRQRDRGLTGQDAMSLPLDALGIQWPGTLQVDRAHAAHHETGHCVTP